MLRRRPQLPRGWEPILIAVLLLIGLLANILYLTNLGLSAAAFEAGDSKFYHRAGAGVAEILTSPTDRLPALVRGELPDADITRLGLETRYDSGLLRSPAYGIFLGLVFTLFGEEILAVVIAQGVLLTLSLLLLYLLGRRLFGRGIGLLALLLAVGYSSFLLYTGEVLTEILTLFLVTGSTYLVVRMLDSRALRWPQLAGAAAALLLLTKISMRFFLPLLLILLVVLLWRTGRATVLRRMGCFLLGLCYVFVPWLIFTTLVFDQPLLTVPPGSGPMHTLYRGNCAAEDGWENDGYGDVQGPELLMALAVRKVTGQPINEVYVDATKKMIASNPGAFLALTLKKVYRMWHRPAYLWRASLGFLRLPRQILWHRIVLLIALLGTGCAITDRRTAWAILLPILYISALHAVSRVEARFQTPVMPLIFLFAAWMVHYVRAHLREWGRAIRRRTVWIALLALLLFVVATRLLGQAQFAQWMPYAGGRTHQQFALLPGLVALTLAGWLLYSLYRQHLGRVRAAFAAGAPVLLLLLPWGGFAAGEINWREWRCRLDSPEQKIVQEIVFRGPLDLTLFLGAALQIDMWGSPGGRCDLRVTVDGQEIGSYPQGLRVDAKKFIYPKSLNPRRHRRLHDALQALLTEIRRLRPEPEVGLEYFRQWYRIPFDMNLLRGKQRIRIEVALARAGGADDYIEVFGDYPAEAPAGQREFVGPAFVRTLYESSTDQLRMFAADRSRADHRLQQTTQLLSRGTSSSFVQNGRADAYDLSPSAGRQFGEYRVRLELLGRGTYIRRPQPDGSPSYLWLFERDRAPDDAIVSADELRLLQRQKYSFSSGYMVF